jgi:hypothetical protein
MFWMYNQFVYQLNVTLMMLNMLLIFFISFYKKNLC